MSTTMEEARAVVAPVGEEMFRAFITTVRLGSDVVVKDPCHDGPPHPTADAAAACGAEAVARRVRTPIYGRVLMQVSRFEGGGWEYV